MGDRASESGCFNYPVQCQLDIAAPSGLRGLVVRGNVDDRLQHHVIVELTGLQALPAEQRQGPPDVRTAYTQKYGSMVDDGIKALQTAIQLKPDYDDAMTYLNLRYRRKADMVESASERDSLTKQADDLLDKVKEIKQKRAEQPSSGVAP